MKRSHKIFLITLATVFSSVALLLLVGVIYISVFAKNNVNVENDERLFNSSKGETFTEYYISKNESVTTVDEYYPVLHESLALGEYNAVSADGSILAHRERVNNIGRAVGDESADRFATLKSGISK